MGWTAVATGVGGVHGFPVTLTSFIGRAGAVREVAGLLDEYRLVTITGPGGSGKTRLADQVARQVADRFADGAWLAELAAVRDPAQVAAAVAGRSGMVFKGRAAAPEDGRRTLTGLRCEYRWEALVRPEPGAQSAAGPRASDADRDRVIDLLKAAFVQGRLDRDEFDARISRALASRTCGELAAVAVGIPAGLTAALPRRPPARAHRRIPFNTAVTGGACMAGLVNGGLIAALLIRSPVAVVLFVAFAVIGTILAIGAMIAAT